MPAEYEKMTEFGLVWTATLDGPESVGLFRYCLGATLVSLQGVAAFGP
jgi:hypothetical protein